MALRVDEEQTVAVFLISGRKGSCMPRLLRGVAALALVLAGCGGDPESTPSPEVTLTTPVDASPSGSPAPTLPAAAQADTKAGAIAFVKHYVELINHAQATGNVDPLAAVEDIDCQSCANGRAAIEGIYGAGGEIMGGELSIQAIGAVESPRYKGWLVTGSLRFEPQSVKRARGAQPEQLTGGTTPVNAFVSRTSPDGSWRVMDWTRGS